MIRISDTHSIDERDLSFDFVRSSGPGGQNVNKVATAVQLRFDPARVTGVTDDLLARIRSRAGRRMTQDGILVIDARRYRSQERNREDAVARLIALLEQAATPPRPRKATKPTRASKRRRMEAKRRRADVKRDRGWSPE